MLLTPLPLSQTVTPSRTPPPSSVTYFMDGPNVSLNISLCYTESYIMPFVSSIMARRVTNYETLGHALLNGRHYSIGVMRHDLYATQYATLCPSLWHSVRYLSHPMFLYWYEALLFGLHREMRYINIYMQYNDDLAFPSLVSITVETIEVGTYNCKNHLTKT